MLHMLCISDLIFFLILLNSGSLQQSGQYHLYHFDFQASHMEPFNGAI